MEMEQDNFSIYHENVRMNEITLVTIRDECDLLMPILTNYREPNLSISLLPYCAFFCVEAGNRLKEMGVPFEQSLFVSKKWELSY